MSAEGFTATFRAPVPAREADPRFGDWKDFVELMRAVEALAGEWPPARTAPAPPIAGRFLL
jgi:hypothetical protein